MDLDHLIAVSRRTLCASLVAGQLASCSGGRPQPQVTRQDPERRVLVFSKTLGFRHDSIPDGIAAIRQLGSANGFAVDATEDSARFTTDGLRPYQVVVFLSTTGDVLNSEQEEAFRNFISSGSGYVGIHAAADTEYSWPWYGQLIGAWFLSHPPVQEAVVRAVDSQHPSTQGLPNPWRRVDEWYDFQRDPSPVARVLLTVDEATYQGGRMGASHRFRGRVTSKAAALGTPQWATPRKRIPTKTSAITSWAEFAGPRAGHSQSGAGQAAGTDIAFLIDKDQEIAADDACNAAGADAAIGNSRCPKEWQHEREAKPVA